MFGSLEEYMLNRFSTSITAVLLIATSQVNGQPTVSPSTPPSTQPAATTVPTTPTELPGATTFIYRDLKPDPMRLFVVNPANWKASDRRPAYVFFFGGGFIKGTPDRSIGTAKSLTKLGFVGIAPDYRTRERFGTTAVECIADARASLRWVQDHASELGIDPKRVVVGGSSAGGSLALWTAIGHTPPGSVDAESPKFKPAALILFSAPTDTLNSKRAPLFGKHAAELSPLQNLDAKMPPVLAFHGDADQTVPHSDGVKLRDALRATGSEIDLVTVPGGDHGFRTQLPEWKEKSDRLIVEFIRAHKLADEPK
jgi:acetyl esterase